GLLATRARAFDEDLDLAHAVLHRPSGGAIGALRGSVRRALARALETGRAAAAPGDRGATEVGDRDDRVVEGRLDVDVTLGHVLLLATTRLRDALPFRHARSDAPGYFLRRTPTVFLGPRRCRAFVLVRCPR